MNLFRSKRSTIRKIGLPPGSPVFTGRKKTDSLHLNLFDYTPDRLDEIESDEIEASFPFLDSPSTSWITLTGLHEADKIARLATHFGIHPLICEDILNIHHRPKADFFDEYIFITLKVLDFDTDTGHIGIDQVSLILGKGFVIQFQEQQETMFDALKIRIREKKGRIRRMEADYLLYAILDIIVDHYFLNMEKISDHIEQIEKQLIEDPSSETLNSIYQLKREVLFLRKTVWPLRESISRLEKSESSLISESIVPYLRDLYDHSVQVIDTVETIRDLLSGMLDLYQSSLGNKMNQVMKMLTIIATIFIPLTFIVGIYGMNFENMPELTWTYAYFVVLGAMFLIATGMLGWFRWKKWM